MKHYSHKAKSLAKGDMNVEFSEELTPLEAEAHGTLMTAKAGGMITRRLVEIGEEMLARSELD